MTRFDKAYFKKISVLLEEILEHESNKMEEAANLFYEIIQQKGRILLARLFSSHLFIHSKY